MAMMQGYKADKDLIFVNNIPRNIFINVYRNAAFQIGNSSSGTCEAASIPLGVINVGRRMVGRKCMSNVIFTDSHLTNIESAIAKVTSPVFYDRHVKGIKNIYGDGRSSVPGLSYHQRHFRLKNSRNLGKRTRYYE